MKQAATHLPHSVNNVMPYTAQLVIACGFRVKELASNPSEGRHHTVTTPSIRASVSNPILDTSSVLSFVQSHDVSETGFCPRCLGGTYSVGPNR
jgi:hypothetical protein